ncbi:Swr1p complex component [Thermoascus aurantiacus ATCC 26904]
MSEDPPAITRPAVDGDTDLLDLDDDYNSSEDEDFQPDDADGAGQEDSDLSSSEAEEDEDEAAAEQRPVKRRKVEGKEKNKADEDAVEMELDSGDEAMIRKAKERKERKKKGKGKGSDEDDEDDVDFDDDDEGGEGGFVKTRSMRMRMQEERKPLAKIEGATIDVDALWEKMNTPGTDSGLLPSQLGKEKDDTPAGEENKETNGEAEQQGQKPQQPVLPGEEMIKIKRTYKFAGEVITEEKLVPKDSAEAKLYLSSNEANVETVTTTNADDPEAKDKSTPKLRRPLRRISRFDPNPAGFIKRSWEKQPTGDAAAANNNNNNTDTPAKGPKLNTVEKSRLDWAAYVDQEGLKEELEVHSKAKEGYLGRMDFLSRVEAKREEERRNARLKAM